MLNKCTFIGNVGRDPEIRAMQDGKEIANLSIGVTEKWKTKSGEKAEKTEWVRVAVFNEGLVRVIKSYVKKGSKIYIEGQLQTRKWTDKDGVDKYSTEVVLSGFGGQLILLDGAPKSDALAATDLTPVYSMHTPAAPIDEIPFAWAALLAPLGALLLMGGVA